MAVVDTITEYDAQTYFPGDTLPDLGSLRCVSEESGKRSYEGLLSDQAKLPTYVSDGSSALLYDGSGNTKVFHFLNGIWYEL